MILSPSIEAIYSNSNLSISEIATRISRMGFKAFEFWGWWNKDIDEIENSTKENGLTIASFCTKMVPLVNPSQRNNYIKGLQESISVATRLNCNYLISQVGNEEHGIPRQEQKQSIIDGLKECAPLLEERGITLIVEPLNTKVDHPGYFLVSSEEGFEIINEVNSSNVKLVFDIYHQQVSEGNLIPNIMNNRDKIAYFHAADHPGRHQLGTGEINFSNVLQTIDNTGYSGYIGLEYFPIGHPDDSLIKILSDFKFLSS